MEYPATADPASKICEEAPSLMRRDTSSQSTQSAGRFGLQAKMNHQEAAHMVMMDLLTLNLTLGCAVSASHVPQE